MRVKAAPVAMAAAGLTPEMTGGGGLIGNENGPEGTPPETTTTVAFPAPPILLAGTEVVTCVALTTLVGSAVLFHCTADPARKPAPVIVSVKAGP